MADGVDWDEATQGNAGFVKLEEGTEKKLGITNWRTEKVNKFGNEGIEFIADVVWEDGEACEKQFTVLGNRLKKKLRPVLEDQDIKDTVYLSIITVGDSFNTQYSVKAIPKPQ